MPLSSHEVIKSDFLAWPHKLEAGREVAHDFRKKRGKGIKHFIRSIAFMGMGGSGIAGRIIKTLLSNESSLPINVIETPVLPSFIHKHTLVFVSSYSGETWEVVRCLPELAKREVQVIILTRGGELARLGAQYGFQVIIVPEAHSPRASLGYFMGILLELIGEWVPGGPYILEEVVKHAHKHIAELADDGSYTLFLGHYEKAQSFYLVGVSGDTEAAIYRAQTQFNENAKNPVVAASFPECAHNLLNGFYQPKGTVLVATFITMHTIPEAAQALEAFSEVLAVQGIELFQFPVVGNSWAQQMVYGIMWADYASCLAGLQQKKDVAAVPMITDYKARCAAKAEKKG